MKTTQKIRPVGKKVLVLEKKPSQYFPGTTIIRPESSKEKTFQAYVIAVGKEVEEINVGDLIQYADYCVPTDMMHDGEKHLLINSGDVFAVIEDAEDE